MCIELSNNKLGLHLCIAVTWEMKTFQILNQKDWGLWRELLNFPEPNSIVGLFVYLVLVDIFP